MKTNKIYKNLKGGYKWTCIKDKCSLFNIKQYSNIAHKIVKYQDIYNYISLFLKNIDNKIEFELDKYTNTYHITFRNYNKILNTKKCLYYYKNNPNIPLPNLLKLLLSIKLTVFTDYIYNKLNYIIMFLPLLDNFITIKNDYFKNLYFTLKEKKNITFQNIDNLLVIVINIINNFIKKNEGTNEGNDVNNINFITFINNILQLFKEINRNAKLNKSLLKKLNINIFVINNILKFIDINIDINIDIDIDISKILTIDKIKKFVGKEIFDQLNLFLEDYNNVMNNVMNNVEIIDIQSYISKKIEIFLEEYNFIDFGILPELFNIKLHHNYTNTNNTVVGGGFSLSNLFTRFKNKKKYSKFTEEPELELEPESETETETETEPDILQDVFESNEFITWENFRKNLDPNTEIIFDVINNNSNKYSILNHILCSISISNNFSDDKNIRYIINNFNTYIYNPLYGKNCFNIDDLKNESENNTTQLIANNSKIKSFTSKKLNKTKRVKGPIRFKHIFKIEKGIGLDNICKDLNQEYRLSIGALNKFDTFIGKVLTLNLKLTKKFFHTKIKNKLLLLFLNYIMKNNIDNYFKLYLDEFITNFNKDKFLLNIKPNYNYIKSYKPITINKKIKGITEDELLKNYFSLYYDKLMNLLHKFIKKYKGDINNINLASDILNFHKNLLLEDKLNEDIFIEFFKYTSPISSQFIEEFFNIQIVNGNDGFNYVQYNNNKDYLEKYIQNNTLQSNI